MRRAFFGSGLLLFIALTALGCDGDGGTDAGTDGGTTPGEDGGPMPDAMTDPLDSGPEPDGGPLPDGGDPTLDGGVVIGGGATTSAQIQDARDALDGTTAIQIDDAIVTYLKPALGDDAAGFFIQAERGGPALFVEIDPTTLDPAPTVGAVVSFRVDQMGTVTYPSGAIGPRAATMISGWAQSSSGHAVAFLVEDISGATDVVDSSGDYESELVRVAATLIFGWEASGAAHESNAIDTDGLDGDFNYRLRVPADLHFDLDMTADCQVIVTGPMWAIGAQALPSAYRASDVAVVECPDPVVVGAAAESATSVRVRLSRRIDMSSITAPGTQFTITDEGGDPLAVSGATAVSDGRAVTLTTAAQTSGETYTVVVASTVRDFEGSGVDDTMNSATFGGFTDTPEVVIQEVNTLIAGGCDLFELEVTRAGNLMDYQVYENTTSILTFPSLEVDVGDIVVVHMDRSDTACRGSSEMPPQETSSVTQAPASSFTTNYDTAFDLYAMQSGLSPNSSVLRVESRVADPDVTDGFVVVDGVVLTDTGTTFSTSASSVTAANLLHDRGAWIGPSTGSTFTQDNLEDSAVTDLRATGTSATGSSLQLRGADVDGPTNWSLAPQTWGVTNGT